MNGKHSLRKELQRKLHGLMRWCNGGTLLCWEDEGRLPREVREAKRWREWTADRGKGQRKQVHRHQGRKNGKKAEECGGYGTRCGSGAAQDRPPGPQPHEGICISPISNAKIEMILNLIFLFAPTPLLAGNGCSQRIQKLSFIIYSSIIYWVSTMC